MLSDIQDNSDTIFYMLFFQISVTTNEDFGLAAVIEDMMIGATLNRVTNGWVCQGDYVKVSSRKMKPSIVNEYS